MGSVRQPDAVVRARRERIVERVRRVGSMSIGQLAEEMDVSPMTVRRDIDQLAEQGMVRKQRGGAAAPHPLEVERGVGARLRAGTAEKAAIAAAAADLVEVGATILIDDSTTCLPLMGELAGRGDVTIVTNFLELARVGSATTTARVLVLGGWYRPEFDAMFGTDLHASLRNIRADLSILSTPAVTDGTLCHPEQESAACKRAMMDSAQRSVLLADSSKFGRVAPFVYAHAADHDMLITDGSTPEAELESWRSAGAGVTVVEVG